MTAEALVERAVALAESSGSVATLRALAVDLATAGRLTVQSEADGSGADLLQQIASQRQRLVEAGKIRERSGGPLAPHERPFDAPANWAWGRLSDVGHELGQIVPAETFTYIDVGGIDAARGVISDRVEVVAPQDAPSRARKLVRRGTVIYSTVRPYLLNVAIVEQDYSPPPIASTAFGILHPFNGVDRRYLFYWLRSRHFTTYVQAGMKGMAYPAINDDKFYSGPIALPPIAEQKRIVAKVDELMALCDRLEAQQQQREHAHAALSRAALARFADAPTADNLQYLCHSSFAASPSDLRDSIITLAVRGRLVAQDPAEGSARDALDRALDRRRRQIEAKGLRRKSLDESGDLSADFTLPSSWCLERLANLVEPENTISYGVLVPGDDVEGGVPFVRAQDLSLANHPSRPNKRIAREIEEPFARTRLTGGEILLCVVGSIGKLGIAPDSWAGANIARAVARIKPISEVDRDYLLLVLQERSIQLYFANATRTLAQPTLNVGQIEQTAIPVPPLPEQRRIVAKVNDLMALVDRLEADLVAARATGEKLMDAVVTELTVAG